jgi:hypothetical protein
MSKFLYYIISPKEVSNTFIRPCWDLPTPIIIIHNTRSCLLYNCYMLRHWHSRADARRKRGAEIGNDDNQPFPTNWDVKGPRFPTKKPYTNHALSVITKDYSVSSLYSCMPWEKVPSAENYWRSLRDQGWVWPLRTRGKRSMMGPCDSLMEGPTRRTI